MDSTNVSLNKRNVTVDIGRLFAAFGVIAIHVPFTTPMAKSMDFFFLPLCVPFFYATSLTYFVSGLKKEHSFSKVSKKTFYRIIVPYLAWTIIYVLSMMAKLYLTVGHHDFSLWRVFFYGESSVQLYYLPELVVMQSLAYSIYLIFATKMQNMILGIIILILAIIYLIIGNINKCFGIIPTESLIIYITIAFLAGKKIGNTKLNFNYIIIGFSLIMLLILINFMPLRYPSLIDPSLFPIGGLGLLFLTIGMPKYSTSTWLLIACSTSYGIYLSHVIFLECFEMVLKKIHHGPVQYDFLFKTFMVTIIFICSMLFTLILKKSRLTKQILLGESN